MDEEEIDLNNIEQEDVNYQNLPPQSKLMQTRMNQQARQRSQMKTQSNWGQSNNNEPLIYQPQAKTESEDQKILRYERVIDQLKKMVENVKKQNKGTRTQFEREFSSKTDLETYLSKAVKKVLKERKKDDSKARKQSAKFYITALDSTPNLTGQQDSNELTQEERERVIELLLGQDKVIALLYDKQPEEKEPVPEMQPEEFYEQQEQEYYQQEGEEMYYQQYMGPEAEE